MLIDTRDGAAFNAGGGGERKGGILNNAKITDADKY